MKKKLKRIANILFVIFARLAHVFAHLACDEVPSLDCDDDDEEV